MCTLVAVDPHHAAPQFTREAMRACDIARPQTAAETVLCTVCDHERVLVVAEDQHRSERPEHLFLSDAITVGFCLHDCGLHVASLPQRGIARRLAAEQHSATLLAPDIHIAQHAVAMLNAREGTHLCLRIERIAEPNRLGKRDEALEELVRDPLMKHEARTRDARLALIVEDSEGRTVDGGGEIRVIEHNVGALSSELELYFLEVTRRSRNDALPHGRGPGERDLRDLGMSRDVLAGHVA